MSPGHFAALKRTIEKDGFVGALLVNLVDDRYELIDGEHRLRAAKELNLAAVPCFVVQITREEAQALTIKLNQIHGDWRPDLLADLVGQLSDPLEDLGFAEYEIEALLSSSEDSLRELRADLQEQASRAKVLCEERYIGFNLNAERLSLLERALSKAGERHDESSNPRAASLEIVLKSFLG